MFDPDEHASALYVDRLVHGRQLEQIVFSTPKPLLTLVHKAWLDAVLRTGIAMRIAWRWAENARGNTCREMN
jgi:hypothetical protein